MQSLPRANCVREAIIWDQMCLTISKKHVEVGFVHHERSASDRRSVRVRLTPAGQTVRNLVYDMYMRQCHSLKEDETIGQEELKVMNRTLQSLEAFWQAQLNSPT